MMNFSDPRFWLDLLQWLVMGVIAVVLWTRKPGEHAMTEVNGLAARLAVVEERMTHMPTSEELAEMGGAVKTIEARAEAQGQQLNRITNQLDRIEKYLLNNR